MFGCKAKGMCKSHSHQDALIWWLLFIVDSWLLVCALSPLSTVHCPLSTAFQSSIIRSRDLALTRSHCLVHMETSNARITTMTAMSHGTCLSHSRNRVHHGTIPT